MTVTNATLLNAYAAIAERTYLEFATTPDVSAGSFGTYTEIDNPSLQVPLIDGPLGFQARAFLNDTTNELVIAFTGTEGFADVNAPEFLPDFIADLSLSVAGASPQDAAAQLFIAQAKAAAQLEVGPLGSFDDGQVNSKGWRVAELLDHPIQSAVHRSTIPENDVTHADTATAWLVHPEDKPIVARVNLAASENLVNGPWLGIVQRQRQHR